MYIFKKQATLYLSFILMLFLFGCEKEKQVNEYTISYFIDDEIIKSEVVKDNDSISNLYIPIREGHNFEGWYYSIDYQEAFDNSKVLKKDTNLYSKWSVLSYTIQVLDFEDMIIETLVFEYGADLNDIVLPDPIEIERHEYIGLDVELPETMPAENLMVRQTYKEVLVLLSFINSDLEEVHELSKEDFQLFFDKDDIYMKVTHFFIMTEEDRLQMIEDGLIEEDTHEYYVDVAFYQVKNTEVISMLNIDTELATPTSAEPVIFISISKLNIDSIYQIIDHLKESGLKLNVLIRYKPDSN